MWRCLKSLSPSTSNLELTLNSVLNEDQLACWSFTWVLWLNLIQTHTIDQILILNMTHIFNENRLTAISHPLDDQSASIHGQQGGRQR